MSEKTNFFEEGKEAYDTVDEKIGEVTDAVDKINTLSDIWVYTKIYNSSESTDEMKMHASIQIINSFASIAGDNISSENGGSYFSAFDSNYVNDAINICSKEVFERHLYDMGVNALKNGDSNAQIYQNMCDNLDKSYEAYKIAIEECCKNDFPTTKKEWDMFYKNYQKNNDPDEIIDKINSWFDKKAEELGLYDNTTPQGSITEKWSEFLCLDIPNAYKTWDTFWKGCGASFHHYWNDGANWIKNEFDNLLNRIHGKVNTAKTAKVVNYDPIILDLDGDGFNIENKENGTHFDLDNNGFAEKINWTSKDGFLCLDLNGNGIIDNGGELFGDNTLLADGTKAKNGFEALAQYDSNGDGIIDKNDEIFNSLRIWVDSDGSGTSGEGELKTLSELGISGIKLNYTRLNGKTGTEAILGNTAKFIREDGTEGSAAELWVSSDLFDTTETLNVEISEEIAKLPDVRSIGNAHSLHTAMALDKTGTLRGYVEDFVNSTKAAEKRQAVENILYFICGAESIDSASRGENMDAKQLAVLETMLGEDFVGVSGANPNTVAAPHLKTAYKELFDLYFTELIKDSVLKEYLPLIRCSEDANGNKVINTELFELVIDYAENYNKENAAHIIEVVGAASLYINVLKGLGYVYTGNFVDDYMGRSSTIAIEILDFSGMGLIADGENPLNGTAEGEYLGGSVNNDEINAGDGDDILIGGKGDDILNGGAGCDTYVFNIGDGNDIVYDHHTYSSDVRNDRIKFGEGITADSVNVRREENNLILEYGSGDSVTVKDHFKSTFSSIEYVEFDDGTTWDLDKLTDLSRVIRGTDGNDTLNGFIGGVFYNTSEIFYAGDGDDIINAYNGDDIIYAGDGNDTVNTGDGDDIIYGGKGDDILNGGAGCDTYVFNIGDGNDIVYDHHTYSSDVRNDRIKFGEGITADSVNVRREENNLILEYGSGDSVTVKDHFKSTFSSIEYVEFSNGNIVTNTQIDKLIQAMASFEADNGMTWNEAVEKNDTRATDIINEMWIKTTA